jgi:hypothetical protein
MTDDDDEKEEQKLARHENVRWTTTYGRALGYNGVGVGVGVGYLDRVALLSVRGRTCRSLPYTYRPGRPTDPCWPS